MKQVINVGVWVLSFLLFYQQILGPMMLIIRPIGIFLAYMCVLYLIKNKVSIQIFGKEMNLYFLFIVYAGLTGYFIVKSYVGYIDTLLLLIQILGLSIIIITSIYINKSVNHIILLIYFIGTSMLLYMILSGQFEYVEKRLTVGAVNANEFGYYMTFSILCGIFLLLQQKGIKKVIIFSTLPFLGYAVLQSGSRKSLIALGVGMLFWILITMYSNYKTKKKINGAYVLAIFALTIAGSYILITYVMPNTVVGQRMGDMVIDQSTGEENVRIDMYREAAEYFAKNPLIGLGLNQFRVYSSFKTYSHSDYAEILANHGLLGFIIYFSIFFLILKHLKELIVNRKEAHANAIKTGQFLLAIMIVILFLGVGIPTIYQIYLWIMIAMCIGFCSINKTEEGLIYEKT